MIRRVEALREQHNIDSKVVSSYMQVFRMLDLDGSGSVEEAELRTGLAAIGKYPTYEELKEMMDVVDEDGSGQIDIVEFVEFMIHVREKSNQQHAARLAAEAEEAVASEAATAEERAATTESPEALATPNDTTPSTIRNSVGGTEENDARVLAISTSNGEVDEPADVASFVMAPSRSWSSPRPWLSSRSTPGSNVMPYRSDNDSQDDAQARTPGIPIEIEAPSLDEGSETALLPQPTSARPRSGRVTSKILPSG